MWVRFWFLSGFLFAKQTDCMKEAYRNLRTGCATAGERTAHLGSIVLIDIAVYI